MELDDYFEFLSEDDIRLLRRRYSLGQVIEDLFLIWSAAGPDEFRDRIEYLPM